MSKDEEREDSRIIRLSAVTSGKKKREVKRTKEPEEERLGLVSLLIAWLRNKHQVSYLGNEKAWLWANDPQGTPRQVSQSELATLAWAANDSPLLQGGDAPLHRALTQIYTESEERALQAFRKDFLRPDPDLILQRDQVWETYAGLLCREGADLSMRVLQHFVWNTKRAIAASPQLIIEWPIMPVFTGRQGSGKSFEVAKLFGPLKKRAQTLRQGKWFSDKAAPLFEENFIIWAEEFAPIHKVERRELLKERISSPTIEHDVLYETAVRKRTKNAQLAAISNHRLHKLINDPHGMRRFWEVRCHAVLDIERLGYGDAQGEIPRESLWRSVDHTQPSPLLSDPERFKRIRELQNRSLKRPSLMQEFLEEHEIQKGNVAVRLSHLMTRFQAFKIGKAARDYEDDVRCSKRTFRRDFESYAEALGVKISKETVKGHGTYVCYLNKSADELI